MSRAKPTHEEESFFNLQQAKWLVGVLGMLIAVVGRDSLLGLILRQARSDIARVVKDEEPQPPTNCHELN